ncbi:MAG: DHHW family protein [Faecalicatena sp.]|uniref:DHHW family protein n=1 Tax=Faecalicatena sp. TaxID=2005360 RepID=UPI00258B404E|nr:DHHW family protein [Faecalicatena sp.]MCI6464834.1 DHHW family protein [Faecalicatena sp.]MDY5619964.1 DHHW family protein [Lachnospiraceae bacterium]
MDNNIRKKKRWVESFVGKAFIICLLIFVLANLLYPSHEKSEEENRMLTQKPKMTVGNLTSGGYMEQYENYQADQFIGRNFLRKVKVTLNRLGGSREENGVFIGKKGQLLEDIVVPDQETLKENLTAIKTFSQEYSDIPMSMILVPDAASVLSGSLPSFAKVADQNACISQVKKELGDSVQWIDAVKAMNKHQDEKIYYKTDHHWTTLGAFYTFQEAASTLGIDADVSSAYVSYPVATDFNGTLAAKSGCRMGEKEEIDIYVPKDTDNDVTVNYVDEQIKTTSLYESKMLKTRDKYAVFLGGNTSLIDIKTLSEKQGRILVIKDSYANSFVPFLAPYFREIVLLDPRYYTGNIQDVMDTYKITDVLFLYNGNTFFQDNNISGVLNSGKSNETGIHTEEGTDQTE